MGWCGWSGDAARQGGRKIFRPYDAVGRRLVDGDLFYGRSWILLVGSLSYFYLRFQSVALRLAMKFLKSAANPLSM